MIDTMNTTMSTTEAQRLHALLDQLSDHDVEWFSTRHSAMVEVLHQIALRRSHRRALRNEHDEIVAELARTRSQVAEAEDKLNRLL